ncbi:MAG: DUF167 domain-containing protein [Patescibacteria group bacterium]|nr:DUF167 domain-containing protein [Patescibacteria group bacterium]
MGILIFLNENNYYSKSCFKKGGVKRIDKNHFSVSVKEPPVQGRANAAIEKAVAEFFGISKSSVRIVSGFTSKQKVLVVEES